MRVDAFDKIKSHFGFEAGIQGKDEYFNSVVLILLIPIDGEYHFIFQKRAASIRQGGEICFPGGKIDETDTTLEQVALRETYEEMGIPPEKIEIVGRIDTLVTLMGVTVDAYIGTAHISLDEMKVNKREVERVIALPVSYFLQHRPKQYSVCVEVHPDVKNGKNGEKTVLLPVAELGLPDTYLKSWGNFRYRVWVYETEEAVIWGITARIVREVVRKIKKLI